MSSFTKIFGRPRSKSEKPRTPPKRVFGDLNAAYASIAQKASLSNSSERGQVHGGCKSPNDMETTNSPLQSPQSESSPSAALLQYRKPEGIRASYLSSDLLLPAHLVSEPSTKVQQAWDPLSTPNKIRASFTMVDFRKQDLDEYFGAATGATPEQTYTEKEHDQSQLGADISASKEITDLEEAQLDDRVKLPGAQEVSTTEDPNLERCGTVQSLATCYNYGQIDTNDDIRSVHGAHSTTEEKEGKEIPQTPGVAARTIVDEVEWTPRSSEEALGAGLSYQRISGPPPSFALPQTPEKKGLPGEAFTSSGSEGASRSSKSYGNTRKLLELSLPRFPHAAPNSDDFFQGLIDFAQSSSSHKSSDHSFAELSIEAPPRGFITRPVTQGEFQNLEQAINLHVLRESQMNHERTEGSLVHVGQISLKLSNNSEADNGPGSSQTVSSSRSDVEADWTIHTGVTPPRTRNGTPPLLFRGLSHAKTDADWETVGDTNDIASSIADYSDSASRSLPKDSLSLTARPIMKLPAHPRYNHSWNLQQDTRNGSYVLTPRYEVSRGASFPSHSTLGTLPQRTDQIDYLHPTPMTAYHNHPFASPAPRIIPSENASMDVPHQPMALNSNTHKVIQSQDSSAWLSTAGGSISHAPINSEGIAIYSALNRIPPLPEKNPQRLVKDFSSEERMNPQSANVGKKRETHSHHAAVFSHNLQDPSAHAFKEHSNPFADPIEVSPSQKRPTPRANEEDIEMQHKKPSHHKSTLTLKKTRLWHPLPHPLATGDDTASRLNSPHLWRIP
ncbi:MAG: hypothetical protein Q9222_005192, partial [Ikaeria aurantiellina]